MRAVEVIAVLMFVFLLGTSIGKIEITFFLPLAALLGWILADLFSGLMHWDGWLNRPLNALLK